MSAEERSTAAESAPMNMMELLPDLMERYMAFFRPGHTEGTASPRVKELARLKIAALNECDT